MTTSPFGRIVEVASEGKHLSKYRGFLKISAQGEELGRAAIDDIAGVIVTAHDTTVTCKLLSDLAARGIPVVICAQNFAPAVIIWPVIGHHAQQRRMAAQIGASKPLMKRLWALLVRAKIQRQAWALSAIGKRSARLLQLAKSVKSGDPENYEAQAARIYWPLMMGMEFRRNPDAPGVNSLLNYGYAVLRSATARAIVSAAYILDSESSTVTL